MTILYPITKKTTRCGIVKTHVEGYRFNFIFYLGIRPLKQDTKLNQQAHRRLKWRFGRKLRFGCRYGVIQIELLRVEVLILLAGHFG